MLFACVVQGCHVTPHSDLVSELKFIPSSLFRFNLYRFQSTWRYYNLLINKSISIASSPVHLTIPQEVSLAMALHHHTLPPLPTLCHITLRIHLRDGSTQTFIDEPQLSCRYYTGAFLSREFQNRQAEDIRAHHLDFNLFCSIVCSTFDITFPGDDIQMGYVYKPRPSQLRRDPKFIIIEDAPTFHNCLSILSNSRTDFGSGSLSTPTMDLHIFKPKLQAQSILPALNSYIDSANTVSSNPPVSSTGHALDLRPVSPIT